MGHEVMQVHRAKHVLLRWQGLKLWRAPYEVCWVQYSMLHIQPLQHKVLRAIHPSVLFSILVPKSAAAGPDYSTCARVRACVRVCMCLH